MKTFGRYLSYRLKQSWLRTLIFTVLSVIFTQNVMHSELSWEQPRSGLFIHAVILGILCTVIPILEIAEYKNRRNLDAFYSFAISRKSLALLHFICGWIQVVAIYTVTYLAGVITLLAYDTRFLLIYLIPYYFCSLALGLILYAVFLFLFNEGNTESDGAFFCFIGIFELAMILTLVDILLRDFSNSGLSLPFDTFWGCVYEPIDSLTVLFQHWLHGGEPSRGALQVQKESYMFALWALIGIAAVIGYFYTFIHKRAEKIGDLSTSWFGYKTMIPICTFSLFHMGFTGTGVVFVMILMLAGYFIYRRSFKLRRSDIIVFGCMLLFGFVFGLF